MDGRFIALEGLDGAGTTTAARLLHAALEQRGHRVVATCQPSERPIGAAVRGYLRRTEARLEPHALALLFAADRLDHVASVIEPALRDGAWVVCDRYVMSSWVYQGLDCDPRWVRTINERAPWPDLTCVITVDAELAAERVAARARARAQPLEIFDALAVQRRVQAAYDALLAEPLPSVVAIDGTATPEAVCAAILRAVDDAGLT